MSLMTRLVAPLPGPPAEVKLPVHSFMAALSEWKRSAPGVNLASISAAFQLSPAEQTQLQTFLTQMSATLTREMVHDVLLLGEGGFYTPAQCSSRLGV